MSILLALTVEVERGQFWTTVAFICGAVTSIVAGYIGMIVAVLANGRVCLKTNDSLSKGFVTAFRAGSVMGFCLTSLGLIVLLIIMVYYNSPTMGYAGVMAEYWDTKLKVAISTSTTASTPSSFSLSVRW
jgi:inorganic pyrophosphatase